MELNSKTYLLQFLTFLLLGVIVFGVYLVEIKRRRDEEYKASHAVRNVALVKTHMCGASAIQNILFRRGLAHNLTFVLPKTGNRIGNPEFFSEDFIIPINTTGGYNILAHETRYDGDALSRVMEPNTMYITILRDPVTEFISLYNAYNLSSLFGGRSLREVLRNQTWREALKRTRLSQKIGANQMAFDLGFEWTEPASDIQIQDFIRMIDQDFSLVLIYERFMESLALLWSALSWDIRDFVVLNWDKEKVQDFLGPLDKALLREVNYIDEKLYNHFLGKFNSLIQLQRENVQKMSYRLEKLSNHTRVVCGCSRTLPFSRRERKCAPLMLREMSFTKLIKRNQGQNM